MLIQSSETHIDPRPAPRRSAGLPIHVFVVDDHSAVRRGIRQLISEQPDLVAIGEAASASEVDGQTACWADVALVDYHLHGDDGLWLARRLQSCARAPRVLIYSAFADHALALAAMIAGADGLLSKATLDEELCVAIRRVANGRQHFPAVPGSLARALPTRLERRDQAIFDMALHGLSCKEIAARLSITRAGLEVHRDQIVGAIAPKAMQASVPAAHAPLDSAGDRRRSRYRPT